MKDELVELLELLVDIALSSGQQISHETEPLCQSPQFTQGTQLTNSDPHPLKTKCDAAVKLRPGKVL